MTLINVLLIMMLLFHAQKGMTLVTAWKRLRIVFEIAIDEAKYVR
ncbi:hypothetical protein EHLJMEHL_01089 [Vreelandella titanicae]